MVDVPTPTGSAAGQFRCPVIGCPQSTEQFLSEYILSIHLECFHEGPRANPQVEHNAEQVQELEQQHAIQQAMVLSQQQADIMAQRQAYAQMGALWPNQRSHPPNPQHIVPQQRQDSSPQIPQTEQQQGLQQRQNSIPQTTQYPLQMLPQQRQHSNPQISHFPQQPVPLQLQYSNSQTSQYPHQISHQQRPPTKRFHRPSQNQTITTAQSQNIVQGTPVNNQHHQNNQQQYSQQQYPNRIDTTIPQQQQNPRTRHPSFSGTSTWVMDNPSASAKLQTPFPPSPALSNPAGFSNGNHTPMPSPRTTFHFPTTPQSTTKGLDTVNPPLQWPKQFESILKPIMIKHKLLANPQLDPDDEKKMHYIFGDFQAEVKPYLRSSGNIMNLEWLGNEFPRMVQAIRAQMVKVGELCLAQKGVVVAVPNVSQTVRQQQPRLTQHLQSPSMNRTLEAIAMPKVEAARIWKNLDSEEQSQLFWDQLRTAKDQPRLITELMEYYNSMCSVKARQDMQCKLQLDSLKTKSTQKPRIPVATPKTSTVRTLEVVNVVDPVIREAEIAIDNMLAQSIPQLPIQHEEAPQRQVNRSPVDIRNQRESEAISGPLAMSPPVTPAPEDRPRVKSPPPIEPDTPTEVVAPNVEPVLIKKSQTTIESEAPKEKQLSQLQLNMLAARAEILKNRKRELEKDEELRATKRLKDG